MHARVEIESTSALRQSFEAAGVTLPSVLPEGVSATSAVGVTRGAVVGDRSLRKAGWGIRFVKPQLLHSRLAVASSNSVRLRKLPMKPSLIALISCALTLAACATTTYKTFETRGDGVIEGKGGAKSVQDGIDIWDYGDPPRRFRVIGIIEDERPGGIIPMGQLRSDMVKKARDVGGHALIQIRSQAQIVGYQSIGSATATSYGNTATATGATTSMLIRRNTAQFAVIQYVD